MRLHSHPGPELHEARRATFLRWAQTAQWLGLVMLLLTIGLAALGDSDSDEGYMSIVTLCGGIGLLALVCARSVIAHYHGDDEQPH